MKKLFIILLSICLALLPVLSFAAESPQNDDIPETEVVDVVPEDPTEEVIPPTVEIVENTEEVTQLQEELQTVFHLTIQFVLPDGTQVAETSDTVLQTGENYSVTPPDIPGYTTYTTVITGTMPGTNVNVVVVYMPEEGIPAFNPSQLNNLYTWDEYETPLGLGYSMMNIGICFE